MHWLERIFAFLFHVALFTALVAVSLDDVRQREARITRPTCVHEVQAGIAIAHAARIHYRAQPKVQPLVTPEEIENVL